MPTDTIHAAEKPSAEVFGDDSVFCIPPCRRPYAWTAEQAGELLDDLESTWGRRVET